MWRAALLVALCSLTFFAGLGGPAITDSDEAFYAEAAREIVESGDWITPRFNYDIRFQKPIFFYWLIAASYVIAGVGETAARFWAAASGLGLTLIAYACARRWYDPDTGLLSGAIVGTSFGAFAMARQSLPDLPLAFFVTLSAWAGFEALTLYAASPRRARRWLLLSSAASALAMLTKGPVGAALPLVVLLPAMGWARREDWRRGRFVLPFPVRDVLLAVLVFLAIATPWYAAVTLVHGPQYLHRFFIGENLERFATARYNAPRPLWFYLPVVVGGLMPWSPFFLLWIRPATGILRGRRALDGRTLRLLFWAAGPLVLFSLSVGKQPRYILPCLVPLAVQLGRTIRATISESSSKSRGLTAAGVLSGLFMLAVAALLYRARPLFTAVDSGWTPLGPLTMAIAGTATLAASLVWNKRALPATVTLASAAMLLAFHHAVLVRRTPEPVVTTAAAITAQGPGVSVCACGAFARNLPFYTGRKTLVSITDADLVPILGTGDPLLAVVDARTLPSVETQLGKTFTRISETRYLNTALLRLRSFLNPDPSQDLQHLIVISNR